MNYLFEIEQKVDIDYKIWTNLKKYGPFKITGRSYDEQDGNWYRMEGNFYFSECHLIKPKEKLK